LYFSGGSSVSHPFANVEILSWREYVTALWKHIQPNPDIVFAQLSTARKFDIFRAIRKTVLVNILCKSGTLEVGSTCIVCECHSERDPQYIEINEAYR